MREKVARLLGRQGIKGKFYYLSESAISNDPSLRGQGLSLGLHQARLAIARTKGLTAVQRTSSAGPMYRTSLKAGMQQIMGPEVAVNTAARTFTPTGTIINNEVDTEMPARVLFMK